MKSSPLFWLAQRRVTKIAVGVILVAALVLLIEAVYVMWSGWAFSESILGGRIQPRTIRLFILMLLISAALLRKYADRCTAFRITFGLLVAAFSILACRISIEFTW
jgi:low temperature requirement protein LtrA